MKNRSPEHPGARSPKEVARILAERAERLARPPAPRELSAAEEILIFSLGTERFGIPLAGVTEVIRGAAIALVPGAPASVAGVIQIRGEIRPVFHLVAMELPALSESVVVLLRRGTAEAGILVERVEDVRPVPQNTRRPAPPGTADISWMTPDLIPVLNPDKIFPEEMA